MKQGDFLFVYGTLRVGASNNRLMQGASHVGSDTITGGVLYDLGWFPGVKLDKTDSLLHGDVYQINDQSMVNQLDSYEGYPSLYGRELVLTDNGYRAWVYTFNGPVKEEQIIENGDWLKRREEALL